MDFTRLSKLANYIGLVSGVNSLNLKYEIHVTKSFQENEQTQSVFSYNNLKINLGRIYYLCVLALMMVMNYENVFHSNWSYYIAVNYLSQQILVQGPYTLNYVMVTLVQFTSLFMDRKVFNLYNNVKEFIEKYYGSKPFTIGINKGFIIGAVITSLVYLLREVFEDIRYAVITPRDDFKFTMLPEKEKVYLSLLTQLLNDLFNGLVQFYITLVVTINAIFVVRSFEHITSELVKEIIFDTPVDWKQLKGRTDLIAIDGKFADEQEAGSQNLRKMWLDLKGIYTLFSTVAGVYLLLLFPVTVASFVLRAAYGVFYGYNNDSNWIIMSRIFSGVTFAARVFFWIELGHWFKTKVKSSQLKIRNGLQLQKTEQQQISIDNVLAEEMLSVQWRMTALEFFQIDRQILTSVVGTSLSYAILLVQLRSNENNNLTSRMLSNINSTSIKEFNQISLYSI